MAGVEVSAFDGSGAAKIPAGAILALVHTQLRNTYDPGGSNAKFPGFAQKSCLRDFKVLFRIHVYEPNGAVNEFDTQFKKHLGPYPVVIINWVHYLGPPVPSPF